VKSHYAEEMLANIAQIVDPVRIAVEILATLLAPYLERFYGLREGLRAVEDGEKLDLAGNYGHIRSYGKKRSFPAMLSAASVLRWGYFCGRGSPLFFRCCASPEPLFPLASKAVAFQIPAYWQ